jgi:GcrA cell cycle regulator
MARQFWTDDKVEVLKKLVDQGLSYRHIGAQVGCSRNAAIGKAIRLGISSKFAPGAGRKTKAEKGLPETVHRDSAARKPKPVEKPAPEPVSPEPVYVAVQKLTSGRERVKLPPCLAHEEAFEYRVYAIANKTSGRDIENIPRDRQCKYIYGDPKHEDAYWCRMDVRPGSHYCTRHSKLMYQPALKPVRKK